MLLMAAVLEVLDDIEDDFCLIDGICLLVIEASLHLLDVGERPEVCPFDDVGIEDVILPQRHFNPTVKILLLAVFGSEAVDDLKIIEGKGIAVEVLGVFD